MQNARGVDRRRWDSLKGWGLKLHDGVVERRRQVERRMPAVAEESLAEFEKLVRCLARKKRLERETLDLVFGLAKGPQPRFRLPRSLSVHPDEDEDDN